MFKRRVIEKVLFKAAKTFPAVVVTGPRQSGKTTLFKKLFSKTHKFVSLEDPDVRIRAKDDPAGFLNQYKPPLIIDEIQYVPQLLSYVKTRIDKNRKAGQWLFTGSQNFALMHNVTQSLAGRVAVLFLLPFSLSERIDNAGRSRDISSWFKSLNINCISRKKVSLSEVMMRGFFPEVATKKKINRKLWCGSYITTYLERDIRNMANIGDLSQFERFLVACASRNGMILNISEIARGIGVSVVTAKRWISLLEAGHQVYLLYPYYKNIGKRIVKSPKIYFVDPALCSYLLGFESGDILLRSSIFGNMFESLVVCDFLKRFLHYGEKPSMYYLRSRDGLEVDLVVERGGKLYLFEIKSASTITSYHISSLRRIIKDLGSKVRSAGVISCSPDNFVVKDGIVNYSWKHILSV